MKYCIYCGSEVNENAVVCVHCGAKVETVSKPEVVPYRQETQPSQEQGSVNLLCLGGFIASFFVGLISLILCVIGLIQANRKKEKGSGLAIAGIVISCFTAVFHVILVLMALPYIMIFFALLIGSILFML